MTFQFAAPWVLILLLVVPFLAAMAYWPGKRVRPSAMYYADTRLIAPLSKSWKLVLRPALAALRLAALALVIVALARPQAVEGREIVRGEGVDIALALDISGSMAALDFQPQDRLEASKEVIEDFIEGRRFDRIGLVVFASEAFIQSPPTVDHDVLGRLVREVRLSSELPIDSGTAVGMGLATAANMLKDSTVASKVIVLLTDGSNNTGEIDPHTAAIAAQALGIKVYTIGAGRPGPSPVPTRDFFGRTSVRYRPSDLDEDTLREIAEITNGRYFRATDMAGLRQVYDEIDSLEKSDVEVDVYTRFDELAGRLIIPALALLAIELLLRHTVFRRVP